MGDAVLRIDDSSAVDNIILKMLDEHDDYRRFKAIEQESRHALFDRFIEYKQPTIHHSNIHVLVTRLMREYRYQVMKIGYAYRTSKHHKKGRRNVLKDAYRKLAKDPWSEDLVTTKLVQDVDDVREGVFIAHKYFGVKTPLWGEGIVDEGDIASFVHDELESRNERGSYRAVRGTLQAVEQQYGARMSAQVMKGYLCRARDEAQEQLTAS
ncbi:hypothetical protein GF367_03620 [Candidatus Woesearchaeota archaeon]|nr:hypothetical protein [Candidatus Woesearchaeota archaeon]